MKRTEISSRSWFPPAAGGKAGEALRKLGLGGRALRGQGGPPATPAGLGIVRRRGGEGPEGPAEPGGPEQGETAPRSPPAPPSEPQAGGDAGTAPPAAPPAPASLVADYSDSSSEAENA